MMRHLSYLLLGAATVWSFTAPQAWTQDIDGISFGDDTGSWVDDGKCDDPRFTGDGMASSTSQDDILRDATDCRALYEEGMIRLAETQFDPDLTIVDGTELGDDSYEWAKDGQCDDARFEGDGMAISPSRDAIKKDRSDCSYGFQTGALTLAETLPEPVEREYDGLDFGTDKGQYAGDNECDDPRFIGVGMGTVALDASNLGNDRKDCLDLYKAGKLVFKGEFIIDDIFFGQDTGFYANDGDCDDPRFEGDGMSAKPARSGIESDATDCMTAWTAKTIRAAIDRDFNGFVIADGIVFGDDSGSYAEDGECDDPGFTGRGMADSQSADQAGKDKTDCLNAYLSGHVKRAPAIPVDTSITADGIRFGDDTSPFANDGECDDPRFEGDGMADNFREADSLHDATDCFAAYEEGQITLK